MTRYEFEGFVRLIFSNAHGWQGQNAIDWPYGDSTKYTVNWITGGKCGGNCWNDGAHLDLEAEPEPELQLLDAFVQEVCPRITPQQHKQLLQDLVYRENRSYSEYYGNFTTYAEKHVQFDQLYSWLYDQDLI